MPELIAPAARLELPWRETHEEWGPGTHEDGAGILPSDDVDSPAGFATWLQRLTAEADPAAVLPAGRVHCTYQWIIDGEQVLGAIALRHQLNDHLLRTGGHIGYGIRPSARRRGLATWALGEMLGQARDLGLDRVLLVCETDNLASARTIEHHGGVRDEAQVGQPHDLRRYWIDIK